MREIKTGGNKVNIILKIEINDKGLKEMNKKTLKKSIEAKVNESINKGYIQVKVQKIEFEDNELFKINKNMDIVREFVLQEIEHYKKVLGKDHPYSIGFDELTIGELDQIILEVIKEGDL